MEKAGIVGDRDIALQTETNLAICIPLVSSGTVLKVSYIGHVRSLMCSAFASFFPGGKLSMNTVTTEVWYGHCPYSRISGDIAWDGADVLFKFL